MKAIEPIISGTKTNRYEYLLSHFDNSFATNAVVQIPLNSLFARDGWHTYVENKTSLRSLPGINNSP